MAARRGCKGLTVNLTVGEHDALSDMATESCMSKVNVIRQALRLYRLYRQKSKSGWKLAWTKDGQLEETETVGCGPVT